VVYDIFFYLSVQHNHTFPLKLALQKYTFSVIYRKKLKENEQFEVFYREYLLHIIFFSIFGVLI